MVRMESWVVMGRCPTKSTGPDGGERHRNRCSNYKVGIMEIREQLTFCGKCQETYHQGQTHECVSKKEPRETLSFRMLQTEQRAWVNHNFPGREWMQPFMGVVEEVGELSHALLKQLQGIRGTHDRHEANAMDAVGDIIVYLADLCSARGWDMQDIIETVWDSVKKRDWQKDKINGGETC
jgi:NTP pyrophosphatase (non-canonical NTP hydrolase)